MMPVTWQVLLVKGKIKMGARLLDYQRLARNRKQGGQVPEGTELHMKREGSVLDFAAFARILDTKK
jgi:hypothetical protein